MSIQIPLLDTVSSKPSKVAEQLKEVIGGGFDVTKFVENFELLANGPGAVEGLRALTLHLAIRGRLVEHETHVDVEATDSKGLVAPYEAPAGWAWRRVDEAGEVKLGRQRSPQNHHGPHMRPYLRVANVHEARIDTSDILEMNFDPAEAERFLLKPNDVLLNEGQSYELVGRPAIYRGEVPGACFQNTLIRFRPTKAVVSAYALVVFRAYMRTGRFRSEAQQTTNIAHLSAGRLAGIEFPLPPLAEQKRIVAKVDELMRRLDDLEAKQAKKRETQSRFRAAALDALTSAEGAEEFEAAWKKVAENFGVLFERAESVPDLRQAILWAAMHGSLTCTETGQAGSLLDTIRINRRRAWERSRLTELMASGTVPKGETWKAKYALAVEPDRSARLVAKLPEHWHVASLDEVAEVIDPNPSHRYPTYRDGIVPLLSTREFRGRDEWDATGTNVPFVPSEVHREQEVRCRFAPRDIILARKGRLGLARHSPPLPAYVFSHTLFVIKVCEEMNADFVLWFLRLDAVVAWLLREMNDNTGVPTLGKGTTERLPLPIPPIGEQRRIVAKVERLMRICDELEAKLRKVEGTAATGSSAPSSSPQWTSSGLGSRSSASSSSRRHMAHASEDAKRYVSPLRYPGGKGKLAPFVRALLDANGLIGGEYVEPYAGGAGIGIDLLLRGLVSRIRINDISRPLSAFWRAVLFDTERLIRRVRNTRLTLRAWDRQKRILAHGEEHDDFDLGFAMFFINRTSRSGILNGGVIGGRKQTGTWKIDARYNAPELAKRIHDVALRRNSIEVSQRDALLFLRSALPTLPLKSLIYLDPPYYAKGHALYTNYYLPKDHRQIAMAVKQIHPQRWVVSYDNVKPVRDLYAGSAGISYGVGYSAHESRDGAEVMYFSPGLVVPPLMGAMFTRQGASRSVPALRPARVD